jgi:two-component system CheB/CheR fusion protein
VDDCQDTTLSLSMLAQGWGYRVHVANDGPTALQIATEHLPSVVLLDVGMPQMSGWELARRLRQLPGMENAYLVAVTGYGQAADELRSREVGCDLHLTKPADPEELQRVLQERADGRRSG